MKKSSIRKKLLVSMVGLIFTMLMIIVVFEIESDKKRSQEGLNWRINLMRKSMNERGKAISSQIAVYTENAIASYNFFNISRIMEDRVKENENLEYGILVDNSGIVHVHTKDHNLVETRLDSENDKFVLQQTKITIQKTEKNGISYLEFITPISIGNNPWGFLRLGFSMTTLDAEIHDSRLSMEQHLKDHILKMLGIFLFCILAGSLLILDIAKRITDPLQQLTEFSSHLAEGNFNAKVPKEAQKANDETGELSRAFVDMATTLAISRNKLEDRSQKLEQEMNEHKLAEEALNQKTKLVHLLQEIAITANETSTIEEAMQVCLNKICAHTGWPVGHVYKTDSKGVRLNPTKIWHLSGTSQRFEIFREVTEITSFETGVGLPGRILKSGKPLWIEDVTKESWFLRAKSAKDIGVKSGFGFPVLEGKKVVSVLEFYSEKSTKPDKSLLEALSNLTVQLGRVTERKRAEKVLKESHERLQGIMDNTIAAIHIKDINGKYTLVNHQFERIARITEKEIMGKTARDLFPVEIAEKIMSNDQKVMEKGSPIEFEEDIPHEGRMHTYLSTKFPLFDSDGKMFGTCGLSTDITERKKMENEQKNFSKRLVELQEQERKRIAAELHDSLAQNMMVINNEAHRIMKKYSERSKDLDSWKLVSSVALESVDEIKNISYNLRPSELDQFGLKDAVQSLIEKMSRISGIEIHKKIDSKTGSISSVLEIQVYRIIQEGLNNIVKHSLASEAMVAIKTSNEYMHIEISDDGKGFESHVNHKNSVATEGFGLHGINERAKMLSGSLKIESTVGKGATLKVTIPIKNDKK